MTQYMFDNNPVKTNARGIGTSVVKVHTGRDLTSGEIQMCKRIFGKSINYGEVKVHPHGAYFPRNPEGNAVTPNGQIHFNPEDYQTDFSASTVKDQAWFIHEMTHVWQHQKGFPVRAVGFKFHLWDAKISGDKEPYNYLLMVGHTFVGFTEYNMEAQAAILQDYYAVWLMSNDNAGSWQNVDYLTDSTWGTKRKQVLKVLAEKFIASPRNASLLPADPYSYGYIRK